MVGVAAMHFKECSIYLLTAVPQAYVNGQTPTKPSQDQTEQVGFIVLIQAYNNNAGIFY